MLPTYAAIGIAAPIILITLRLLQGHSGLWYPVIIRVMTVIAGTFFLRETNGVAEA